VHSLPTIGASLTCGHSRCAAAEADVRASLRPWTIACHSLAFHRTVIGLYGSSSYPVPINRYGAAHDVNLPFPSHITQTPGALWRRFAQACPPVG
jgi:hypothetical protein